MGLSTAVKVEPGRPNTGSVHANARKGATDLPTLLWELAFVDDGCDDVHGVGDEWQLLCAC